MRKKRTLVLSCTIILLCTCIIVGGSYALLSERFDAHSHLVAGKLDIKLERLSLTYPVLTEYGTLKYETDDGEKDFSGSTGENVFGIDRELLMVPTSYYEVVMRLTNKGNVAFDYSVQVKLLNDDLKEKDLAFARQLMVEVYAYDGETNGKGALLDSQPLSNFMDAGKTEITGTMYTKGEVRFVVRVVFPDNPNEGEAEYNKDFDNNYAMEGEVSFDLVVTATQRTDAAEPTT